MINDNDFFTIFAYCFSKTDFYMKKLIFLLCFPLVAGAQEVLSGRITDSLGLSVPYVNIGVVGKGKGTVSNSKGQYQIDLTGVAPKDSIYFSHLNYYRRAFAVKDLQRDPKVVLVEHVFELPSFTVSQKKPKLQTIKGMGTYIGQVYYGGKDVLNKEEIGNIITLKHTYLAKEFELPVLKNTMPNLVLRLQILKIEDDGTLTPLMEKPIYLSIPQNNQKQKIVQELQVVLPKGRIWVGLRTVEGAGDGHFVFEGNFSGGYELREGVFKKFDLSLGVRYGIKGIKISD